MATPPTLPPITALPTLSTPEQTQALDLLFEPSPAIHALLLPFLTTPFPSYPALIDAAHPAFLSLTSPADQTGPNTLHEILSSHPRLGAKKVESAQSAAEQSQLSAAAAQLRALNDEYEARFPGLRYVVFVNGREKDVIMGDMRRRIDRGDAAEEEREAIRVCAGPVRGLGGTDVLGHVRYCKGPGREAPAVRGPTLNSDVCFGVCGGISRGCWPVGSVSRISLDSIQSAVSESQASNDLGILYFAQAVVRRKT